jgi:hypothetical protein
MLSQWIKASVSLGRVVAVIFLRKEVGLTLLCYRIWVSILQFALDTVRNATR